MFKRALILLLLFVAWQCIDSSPTSAQAVSPCLVTQRWDFPNPILFGWSFFSSYPGTLAYLIAAPSANCAPKTPEGDQFCSTEKSPTCSKPIALNTGTTYIKQTDVNVPGLGGGLNLTRTWTSVWPSSQSTFQMGLFGLNWRSTYEEQIFMGLDGYFRYSRGDGTFLSYGVSSSGWTLAGGGGSIGLGGTMTFGSDGQGVSIAGGNYWTIVFQSGETRLFDTSTGKLVAIIDRNGNKTQIAYDSAGRLATVTDPASRHLYFGYGSSSNTLVTSVTSDFGVSLTYTYNAQGRLTQVTEPDQSTLNFTYDSKFRIASVTDMNGKVLEAHTYYSSGRGATASRAGGVEAVSVTYP